MKISMSKIQLIYGDKMFIGKPLEILDSKIGTYTIKKAYLKFPKYLEIMNAIGDRLTLEKFESKKKLI